MGRQARSSLFLGPALRRRRGSDGSVWHDRCAGFGGPIQAVQVHDGPGPVPPRSRTRKRPLHKVQEQRICLRLLLHRLPSQSHAVIRPNEEQANRRESHSGACSGSSETTAETVCSRAVLRFRRGTLPLFAGRRGRAGPGAAAAQSASLPLLRSRFLRYGEPVVQRQQGHSRPY